MKFFFYFFLFSFYTISAQINANSVLTLHKVSNADMLAITSPNTGSLIYNTDDDGIYKYNGLVWVRLVNENSLKSIVLNRDSADGGFNLECPNDTFRDFPLTASHIRVQDADIFTYVANGEIEVLEDGVYIISAGLSTSNLPAGDRKYIIAVFRNGTRIGYLTRGYVTIPTGTQFWGGSGVLMLDFNANDTISIEYVLNNDDNNVSGNFLNIGITKMR